MADGHNDEFVASLPALPPAARWVRLAIRLTLPYPALLLVAASPFSGLEIAVVSCSVAIAYAALALASWRPGRLLAALFAAFTLPYILFPLVGYAALLCALPVLPLLFDSLARNALPGNEAHGAPSLTPLASSLMVSLVCIGLFAMFVGSGVLLAACGIIALPLGVSALMSARRLGRVQVTAMAESVTVVAGHLVRTGMLLESSDGPHGWVRVHDTGIASKVTPAVFPIGAEPAALEVDVTPTLSGPTQVLLGVVLVDRYGLTTVARQVPAVSLDVVPRARVAERVARLFLQGSGGAAGLTGAELSDIVQRFLSTMRGVEYQSSRLYAPGDSLHEIDWKHTARLERLTTKEFAHESSSSGVVAVSLLASDADEADRLAFELLSAALAVVRVSFAARLILYARADSEVTAPLGDRALVRKALEAVQHIVVAPVPRRVLRVAGVQNVAQARARLEGAPGEAAARLRDLLGLEAEAVRRVVESSPLSVALERTRPTGAAGWFVAISSMGYDAEAVATQLHAMERRGVRALLVNVGSRVH